MSLVAPANKMCGIIPLRFAFSINIPSDGNISWKIPHTSQVPLILGLYSNQSGNRKRASRSLPYGLEGLGMPRGLTLCNPTKSVFKTLVL